MGVKIAFCLGFCISLINLNAQHINFQEEVHLSVSTTNILVGESLHFSAFVYSNSSKKVSKLSSVLYVEFLDESGRPVYQTKIGLRNGRGTGSIYIQPDWRSTTYRLIAYTRWMKNYKAFYAQQVLVLNPYNGITQNELIAGNPSSTDKNLWTNAAIYEPAQAASVDLGSIEPATLSIAVKRANSLYYPNTMVLGNSTVDMESFKLLPEYKYALVQGSIKKDEGRNLEEVRVNMAIKGSAMQVSTTKTDSRGNFWMSYNPELSTNNAQVQLYVEGDTLVQVALQHEFYESHSPLDSGYTILDSLTTAELVFRSVNSQIERAYFKGNETTSINRKVFTLPNAEVYYLDDYKRFSSVRDTFIELIKYVGVSKAEDNYKMSMRCNSDPPGLISLNESPLILLDGLKVSPEDILNQSPNNIEKIEVLPEYYFVNDIVYKGLIYVHTFGRKKLEVNPTGQVFSLADYQAYTEAGYSLSIDSRLPHYESQIYWQPILAHYGGQLILNFWTSRLPGTYEVLVTGITKTGQPINLTKYFRVSTSVQN